MKQINLFYNSREHHYYCGDDNFVCVNCKKDIFDIFGYVTFWNKKKSFHSIFCLNCMDKIKEHSIISEKKIVINRSAPFDSYPVFIRSPILKNYNDFSVFQAADVQIANELIIRKTKHSYGDSWEGCRIGNKEFINDLSDKSRIAQILTNNSKKQRKRANMVLE